MGRRSSTTTPPATNPQSRENRVIAAAYDLAEKQILEDRASSQVITHFLKLGTEKARLECEILEAQRKLAEAKTENLSSSKRIEELYENAVKAMRHYNGDDWNESREDQNVH